MPLALRKVTVPRHHQLISQGQNSSVFVEVADAALTSVLTVPSNAPTYSLFDPYNNLLVSNVDMATVSPGVYTYDYQTDETSPLGLYTATLQAIDTTKGIARLEKIALFKIIEDSSTIPPIYITFTFFAIKDQTGNVWYWYASADGTLTFQLTVPAIFGTIAEQIVINPIPYWIEVSNPTPALRYILPSVSGEPTVQSTLPSVGTGIVGSPSLVSVSGDNYTITLNLLDEIV